MFRLERRWLPVSEELVKIDKFAGSPRNLKLYKLTSLAALSLSINTFLFVEQKLISALRYISP